MCSQEKDLQLFSSIQIAPPQKREKIIDDPEFVVCYAFPTFNFLLINCSISRFAWVSLTCVFLHVSNSRDAETWASPAKVCAQLRVWKEGRARMHVLFSFECVYSTYMCIKEKREKELTHVSRAIFCHWRRNTDAKAHTVYLRVLTYFSFLSILGIFFYKKNDRKIGVQRGTDCL